MVPVSRRSEPCGHVDAVTFLQCHHGLFHVRQHAAPAAEIADLALANERIDVFDLDVEQLFHRFLDLRLRELGVFDNNDAAVFGLGGQRVLEGKDAHLFGQVDRMAAHHRAKRTPAAAEQIGALGAMAGAAGALLLVHLLAGSPDLGAPLHLVGAGAALGELPDDAALDEVLARLQPEDRIRQVDRALLFAVKSRDLEFHAHAPCAGDGPTPVWSASTAPPATRNLPGCGASFGRAFLTAPRPVIQPPLAPGTAPSTRIRPRSTSVCTTLRLSVVTRSTPIWPGIFLFLNVRPGS